MGLVTSTQSVLGTGTLATCGAGTRGLAMDAFTWFYSPLYPFLPPPRGRTWWGFPNSGAWPCCLLDLGTSLPLGLQDAGAGRNQYNVAVRSVCPGEGSPSAAGWMAQLVLFLIPYVLVKSKTFHTKLRKQNKGGCVLEQDSLGLKPSSPAVSYLTWGKFIACVKRG